MQHPAMAAVAAVRLQPPLSPPHLPSERLQQQQNLSTASQQQSPQKHTQRRPASAGLGDAAAVRDARSELARKEQELSALRAQALRTLEAQLAEANAARAQLSAHLEELKADFKYNLTLLAERDAELEAADAAAVESAAQLAAAGDTVTQLQSQLVVAQAGAAVQAAALFVQICNRCACAS